MMTTKMMTRTLMTLAMMTALTACSRSGVRTYDADRSEKGYRAAMTEYAQGDLEAARKGFEETLVANPVNAAARFQLACILQDNLQDPLAAYVEYKVFLSLDPRGDKSKIAEERARICLRDYQTSLLKDSSGLHAGVTKELSRVQQENDARRTRIVSLERDLAEARAAIEGVTRENKRLHSLLDGFANDQESGRRDISREAELFGSDEETDRRDIVEEAKEIARIAKVEDAANGTESSLLPKQSADAKAKRDAKRKAESEARAAEKESEPKKPDTYTVAEGDTLYRIAQRFYGRRSDWVKIRNANKEKISNDGKLRIGDVIKLP